MTQEDIIRMAREAGFELDCCSLEWHGRIERFAALVAAAEPALNLNCKSEQARLATLWGYVKAQPEQKDAARYQHIKGMARAMSLDMGGNHYWHMGLRNIRGPNLDEAIDRAIEAKLKEKNT